MKPFRVFVTGTDTGVGKTETSCALLSLLADAKLEPAPMKPYETGVETEPSDALALKIAAKSDDDLALVCPHRFREPLAPGVAAAREGRDVPMRETLRAFRRFEGRSLVVEGAGGLFVPIDERRDMIDLARAMKLPVVLVARAGLGTLNHTALSLEALGRRRIPVVAVVLVEGPTRDPSERDNAAWIAKRHEVRVVGPVKFEPDAKRRRAAFRRALNPLVREWLDASRRTRRPRRP